METFRGLIRTPADAIILFEACRLGHLPRVQRRLSEKERQSICSGSVFVWDEREAGMRRWTDGKSWSASRVSGSFLTYREMEGKRGGNGSGFTLSATNRNRRSPDSTKNGSDSDADGRAPPDDDGQDGYRYKPDGLMKQSFSITTATGNHLHLISYYARNVHHHPAAASGLVQPSQDPLLRQIQPPRDLYPQSTPPESSNAAPAVTRAPIAATNGPHPAMGPGAMPRPFAPQPLPYSQQGPPPFMHGGYAPPYGPHGPMPPAHAAGFAFPPVSAYNHSNPPLTQVAVAPAYARTSTPPVDGSPRVRPAAGRSAALHQRSASSGSILPGPLAPFAARSTALDLSAPPSAVSAPAGPGSRSNSPASTPQMGIAKLDGRLVHPSPLSRHSTLARVHDDFANNTLPALNTNVPTGERSRTPSPARSLRREWGSSSSTPVSTTTVGSGATATSTSTDATGASLAQAAGRASLASGPESVNIPSIGSIMHNVQAPTDAELARRSHSPPSFGAGSSALGGLHGSGPPDMPHDRFSFGEDLRALRVLDRAFKT